MGVFGQRQNKNRYIGFIKSVIGFAKNSPRSAPVAACTLCAVHISIK
jgi:hypothetical protein